MPIVATNSMAFTMSSPSSKNPTRCLRNGADRWQRKLGLNPAHSSSQTSRNSPGNKAAANPVSSAMAAKEWLNGFSLLSLICAALIGGSYYLLGISWHPAQLNSKEAARLPASWPLKDVTLPAGATVEL